MNLVTDLSLASEFHGQVSIGNSAPIVRSLFCDYMDSANPNELNLIL